ncbi:hypothetical protein M104_1080 [Bacteroides fragilis str. 1007-1-F |uniref:Uncharacterized protein n=1 Tax=Bacteroides fragilis str. 1007-1-F \|nr:hypothetical protein M077_1004 [Bacteroides fragilis str. 2-F-2 \
MSVVKVLRMGLHSDFFVTSESSACGCQPEDGVSLSDRIWNNNRRYWGKQ